jgi:hypothetical protein
MLNKLLFNNRDKWQFRIAILGSLLGSIFLLLSLHYLIRINQFGKGAEILGPNTLIVQKRVSNSSSLNLSKTNFELDEINRIKDQKFIVDAQAIKSNTFDVSFETSDPLVPRFRSDVFVQTVDEKFIDIESDKWNWKQGDSFVPIIMPRDFLIMLNTFMSASGIPQVSEDLAKELKFKFTLVGNNKKEWVDVRIVGFSSEIPSLLVPEDFMRFSNLRFGDSTKQKITQLMLTAKEGEFGKVESFFEERGFESRKSQVLISKLKSVISLLFVFVSSISLIAVFSGALVFFQYIQLLIANNRYEIRTLIRLGYLPNFIIMKFVKQISFVFGVITVVSIVVFSSLKFFTDQILHNSGLYVNTDFTFLSLIVSILIFLLFVTISFLSAKSKIIKEF